MVLLLLAMMAVAQDPKPLPTMPMQIPERVDDAADALCRTGEAAPGVEGSAAVLSLHQQGRPEHQRHNGAREPATPARDAEMSVVDDGKDVG